MEGFFLALAKKEQPFETALRTNNEESKWEQSLGNDTLSIAFTLPEENIFLGDVILLIHGEAFLKSEKTTAEMIASIYREQGEKVLEQLGGHFSLLLVDGENQSIFCLSDKFSTHPVYYSESAGLLVATDLTELADNQNPRPGISLQALYDYFYFHCIPSPTTIYQGCYKLEPSTRLKFRGSTELHKVWYPEFHQATTSTKEQLAENLRVALNAAIQPYCDRGDQGAFLSGGLDSSSVTAYLDKNTASPSRAKTFTIGFSEEGYDETSFAKIVSEKFNTEHHVRYVTPEDIHQALPEIAAYFDEPFGNSSALPAYFCAKTAKDAGVNLLLAGDGGDELYAGNERYAKQKVFTYWKKLPGLLRTPIHTLVKAMERASIPYAGKAANYIFQANQTIPERLQFYNFLHQNNPEEVFTQDTLKQVNTSTPFQQYQSRFDEIDADDTDNMLYLDWKFTLADNDLVKVSNMTEMAGVKVKYPMLADALVEHCQSVPPEMKLPGKKLRDFYKYALSPVLPAATINKSKHGFGLPFGRWLRSDDQLSKLAADCLARLAKRNLIKPDFVEKTMTLHQDKHAAYYGELIWLMVMLELWLSAHEPDFKVS